MNIPRSTAHYAVSKGYIKCINNKVNPYLNTKQMINRVKFCISHLDLPNQMLIPFNNLIHIDKKWFYMNQISRKVYQSPTEKEPIRRCTNKRFIRKVMFLVDVSQPRQDHGRKVLFDGKLGCWPLTIEEPCSCNSKNRPTGVYWRGMEF